MTEATPIPSPVAASRGLSSLSALRRFVRPRPSRERCELCAIELPTDHQHLFSPKNRSIHCSCQACSLLFSGGQSDRYRLIPRDSEYWPQFQMDDVAWDSLNIPINLAFLTESTAAGRVVAYYPSPAGATEAALGNDAWQQLLAVNPRLGDLQKDVEALLVNRIGAKRDYFRAPIDQCYKLVGLIRAHWRGLSGGAEVWKHIDGFFIDLQNASK